jgi:hypothetical protein
LPDEECLSITEEQWIASKESAEFYQHYVGERTQYLSYKASVDAQCIAATYSETDLEKIVRGLYLKKIVTVNEEILGLIKPDPSAIYMFNPGGHFDVLYADLDGKIEADLSSTKSSNESEVDDASETNEKKTSNSKSKPQEKAEEKGKSLIDQWIVPYPTKFETSETGKAWSEAKKDVLEAFDSTLPWGKAAKDENGNTIKWPLGFLNKMSLAVVDLALTIAWGVFEYIVLGLCKKIPGC